MAFGKMSKEDLIAMGLDPDKTVKKEDLDVFKQGIDTTINDSIKNSIAALEQSLTEKIAASIKPVTNPDTNVSRESDNTNTNEPKQIDAMTFMEDPMKHVREEQNKVAAALLANQLKMQADMVYENMSSQLPGFKNEELRKEIDAEWNKYAVKQNPRELLKNLHDLVIGRHAQEIAEDTAKKAGKYNMIHSGGGSRTVLNTPSPTAKPEDNLTASELAAAKNFGMTAEEYVAQKASLKYA